MPNKTIKKTVKKTKTAQKDLNISNKKSSRFSLAKIANALALVIFLSSALFLGNIFGNKFFSNKTINVSQSELTGASSTQNNSQQSQGGENSTSDAKLQEIFKNSVDTNSVEINNCEATPKVAKIGLGKEFEMINKDNAKHSIKLWDKTYDLAANSTIKITADFGKGVGFYGIQCDDKEAGYINIP